MILKLILVVVWIYILTVLKRGNLGFYHFLLGSVGTFLILLNCMPYVKDYFIQGFVWLLGYIGDFTGMYESYAQSGMFFINHNDTVISLYVDMECSGIIEMIVYVSLLAFFPIYKRWEKIYTVAIGLVSICVFNFIRIFVIISMIFYFGTAVYSLAHAIVGRIIFYVLILILYFYVFTRQHVIRQKVGKFTYENVVNKQ